MNMNKKVLKMLRKQAAANVACAIRICEQLPMAANEFDSPAYILKRDFEQYTDYEYAIMLNHLQDELAQMESINRSISRGMKISTTTKTGKCQ
jgi:hypothetical protein